MTNNDLQKLAKQGATKMEMHIYILLKKSGSTIFDASAIDAILRANGDVLQPTTIRMHRSNMVKKGLLKETASRSFYELVKL